MVNREAGPTILKGIKCLPIMPRGEDIHFTGRLQPLPQQEKRNYNEVQAPR